MYYVGFIVMWEKTEVGLQGEGGKTKKKNVEAMANQYDLLQSPSHPFPFIKLNRS